MKVFNARHFLRHISMPTLREFTDTHVLGQRLTIDWTQPPESLPAAISDAVDAMTASSRDPALDVTERESLEKDLLHWCDDLRRAHLLGHGQAIAEFRSICANDPEVATAFASRDERRPHCGC